MKNNYRKLKFSILLQTVLVTALTVLVGGFLLNYVIDGIYNDSFARNFVKIMTKLQVSEPTARSLYWKLIGDNKTFFMVVGFLLLFALFFYVALSKMTKYLDQVGEGIDRAWLLYGHASMTNSFRYTVSGSFITSLSFCTRYFSI